VPDASHPVKYHSGHAVYVTQNTTGTQGQSKICRTLSALNQTQQSIVIDLHVCICSLCLCLYRVSAVCLSAVCSLRTILLSLRIGSRPGGSFLSTFQGIQFGLPVCMDGSDDGCQQEQDSLDQERCNTR